ncbi:MAG: hypothetical protein AAF570_15945, partial [Bacteroidota bacterium]
MPDLSKLARRPYILALPFVIVLLGYFAGLFIDILEIDAAQYATMAREIAESNDFLHLFDKDGGNYLDKPPMVFWTAALSFKLFGVGTVAEKGTALVEPLSAASFGCACRAVDGSCVRLRPER